MADRELLEVLARAYVEEADLCQRLADEADGDLREKWLRMAEQWRWLSEQSVGLNALELRLLSKRLRVVK